MTGRTAAVLFLVVAAARPAAGQPVSAAAGTGAYRTVTIAVGGARAMSGGSLDATWSSGTGARFDVGTPFHVGEVAASVVTLPYTARADAQPDYRAWIASLEWRVRGTVGRLRPYAGLGAGNYLMIFDGVETKGAGRESEILVSASAGVDVAIAGATAFRVAASAINVFTSTPIRSSFLDFGITHTVRTPRWLGGVIE